MSDKKVRYIIKEVNTPAALRVKRDVYEDQMSELFSRLSDIAILMYLSGHTLHPEDFGYEDPEENLEAHELYLNFKEELSEFIEDCGVDVAVAIYLRDYLGYGS